MLVHGVLTSLLQTRDGNKETLIVSLGLVPIGELARHAQMHKQPQVVELEKEKFPATLDVANHLSAKRRDHFMWLRAQNNTLATNFNLFDALVANAPQQTETNRFDFR